MKVFIFFLLVLFAASVLPAQTIYFNEDFETGNLDNWVRVPNTDWEASSDSAISGSYSMKHNSTLSAGESHAAKAITNLDVQKEKISWKFNLKSGDFDPNNNERFWVYLMVHDTMDVDGYAVGVNISDTLDILELCRVSNSLLDTVVLKSSFDWDANDWLGIEVLRDTTGNWELLYDVDGNFDNLVSAGSAIDTEYTAANYFGLSFFYQAESKGKLWLDDILIQTYPTVEANLVAFLEGPFDSDSMKTSLSSDGVLPLEQPFNVSPWNYSGNEALSSLPEDMVDWIMVQLRTGTDSSTTIATRAALLMKNGAITDLDGTSNVLFEGVNPGNFYVVLRHRNHLPIMSANTVALSDSSILYNFSTAVEQAYGSAAQVEIATGVFGMYTGDANGNGQVQTDDKNDVWALEVGTAGYIEADFNLNGQVQTDDKNDFWKYNVGRGTQVPF